MKTTTNTDRSPLDILLAGGPDMTVTYVPSAEEVAEDAARARWNAERIARIEANEAAQTARRLRRENVGRRVGW